MRQYLDLLKKILEEGEDVQSGATLVSENRKPVCRFLLSQQLRFDLREGFPAVTTKRLYFDTVVDEILWFLRGETNINTLGRAEQARTPWTDTVVDKFIKRNIWNQWADETGDVKHIYSEQWRRWEYLDDVLEETDIYGRRLAVVGVWDQVAHLIEDLEAVAADPGNRARRRIILTAWNPPLVPEMGLAPCHTLSQWLPTNGYLDVVGHWRSIDMFTGCPFNIAQYALLAYIFGGVTGLIPRHFVANIADCHLYDNQFEQAREQVTRVPYPLPDLKIDDRFFETAPDLTPEQLRKVDHSWFRLVNYQYDKRPLRAEVAV